MNPPADLQQIAAGDLTATNSIADMAARESWTDPDAYAITLAEAIARSGVSLDAQRERLQALVGIGAAADRASAQALGQHLVLVEALAQHFAKRSFACSEGHGRDVAAERYVNAALKAQKAALAVLSAMKILREGDPPPTTPAGVPAPAPTALLPEEAK